MKDYKKQYLDPRWQKKRLEILKRDEWCCQICYNDKETLHIHHRVYIQDRNVWDYPNELLTTLCKECHEEEKENIKIALSNLCYQFKRKFFSSEIDTISHGIEKMSLFHVSDVCASILSWSIKTPKMQVLMKTEYFNHLKTPARTK